MVPTSLLACTLRYGWIGLVGSLVSCSAGRVSGDIEECGCGSYHDYSVASTARGAGSLRVGDAIHPLSVALSTNDYALPLPGQTRQFSVDLGGDVVRRDALLVQLQIPPTGFSDLREGSVARCNDWSDPRAALCADGSTAEVTPLAGELLFQGDIEQADVEGVYRNHLVLHGQGQGLDLHLMLYFEERFFDGSCY